MTDSLSNPRRRRLGLIVIAASIIAIAGGALAFAHSGDMHHGPMSGNSEQHLEHVQAMLTKIGASDAQKSQIAGILKPAFAEMAAARDAHSAAFRQFHEAITAPSIDRARLESLRAEQLKSLDEASKRLVTAISDAAEVLTPDQRAAIAKQIEEHHRG
jgi:Spy/CpxP family protein refolding chaperone